MLYFCSFFVIVSYENAVKFLKRSRNVEPAIYNESRLFEQPIPAIQDEPVDEMDSQFDNNGSTEPANCSASHDDNVLTVDPLFEPENTNEETDQTEQKPNIPQLGIRVANNNGILNLIDEDEDDDIELISYEGETFEMIVGAKGFAMPMILMHDNRVKRENDELSGSEPYYETVSMRQKSNGSLIYNKLFLMQKEKARVYKIGDNLTEFPYALIVKLLAWNKPPRQDDVYYDKRFTRALLMALVPEDRLASSNVSDQEKQFIQSKLTCSFSSHSDLIC